MTTTELKWYITSQIGSKISANKIYKSRQVYKKLQSILGTDNIDVMLEYLHSLGFVLITKQEKKENISEPVKTYYIEPKDCIKSDNAKKESIYKGYSISRSLNKEKGYKQRCNEKRREKIKYGLSKPYYRENTNYNSIW